MAGRGRTVSLTEALSRRYPDALAEACLAGDPRSLLSSPAVFDAAYDLAAEALGRRPTALDVRIAVCAIAARLRSLEFLSLAPQNRGLDLAGWCRLVDSRFGQND